MGGSIYIEKNVIPEELLITSTYQTLELLSSKKPEPANPVIAANTKAAIKRRKDNICLICTFKAFIISTLYS